MKINIKKILGGILLSSLAALPNASGKTTQQESVSTVLNSLIAENEDKKKDQSKYTFVLPTSNQHLMLARHSSHSSHGSHGSHSSHSSHSSSSGGTSYRGSSGTRSSHSSHSSHYSHASHYSSSGGTSYRSNNANTGLLDAAYERKLKKASSSSSSKSTQTSPSTTKKESVSTTTTKQTSTTKMPVLTTTKPTSNAKKPVSTTTTKQTKTIEFKTYQLGERELREGMSGGDVLDLTLLLIRNDYFAKETDKYDYITIYTPQTSIAVSAFQLDVDLPATGVCDKETATRLKNFQKASPKKKEVDEERVSDDQTNATVDKSVPSDQDSLSSLSVDENVSSYQEIPSINPANNKLQEEKKEVKLGDRSLSIGAKGPDVDELIHLLKRNEFLLDESTFFDLAVRDAIKVFQNNLHFDGTGIADKKTIKALLDYKE